MEGRQLVTLLGGPLDRRRAIVPDGCVNLPFKQLGYYEPLDFWQGDEWLCDFWDPYVWNWQAGWGK